MVVELLLGILIGPQGLDIARVDPTTELLGNLGLGMLFFFAGYEIDFDRIKGRPLELAAIGWALSLALAYGIGGALAERRGHPLLSSTRARRWRRRRSAP